MGVPLLFPNDGEIDQGESNESGEEKAQKGGRHSGSSAKLSMKRNNGSINSVTHSLLTIILANSMDATGLKVRVNMSSMAWPQYISRV